MKALLFFIAFITFSLVAAEDSHAQTMGKVTKVTASTSTTGTIVLEDTLAGGAKEYLPFRRGDVVVKVAGSTTSDAWVSIYSKTGATPKAIWQGSINSIRVVGAGNGTASPTITQKIAYLQANSY
ncbi:hypothetical protein [Larkinella terrae]|uniref:DUF5666 domain-containing protein n=1 Tax=Larkinella terrae TaxID=2025311 RepID=A0A7K0EK04_9BACT|nr:hypothetical protein [Larkinella terrae]MRS61778.1 hypothetical protein [Larkinella terrae]